MPQVPQKCPKCGKENYAQAVRCFACHLPLTRVNRDIPTGYLQREHRLKDDRYLIWDDIGEGGMSVVYRAKDLEKKSRYVAIKKMQQHLFGENLLLAKQAFQREAEMLRTLKHSQIPVLYDYFYDEDHWHLVMELIEGKCLTPKISLTDILNYSIQLCNVLEYLHKQKQPLVFRDLKPSNIMLAHNGTIYLLDFGIARFFQPGQEGDTLLFFSEGYAAPELRNQRYDSKLQTTPLSDIYSLGITIHVLLSGVNPRQHQLAAIHSLAALGIKVPQELDALIAEMVSEKMKDRPDIDAVKQRLLAIQQSITTSSGSLMPDIPPFAISQPSLEEHLSQEKGQFPYCYQQHQGSVTLLSWSPDSRMLATASSERDVRVWLALTGKAVGGGYTWKKEERAVPDNVDNGDAQWKVLAWSLDGTFLALGYERGFVKTYNVQTSKWSTISANIAASALAWSCDKAYLAFGDEDGRVCVWKIGNNNRRVLDQKVIQRGTISSLSWSPGGHFLASGCFDGTVHIWSLREQKSVYCYAGHQGSEVNAVAWSPDGRYLASADSLGRVHVWRVM